MAKVPAAEVDIKEKIYTLYTELVQAEKDKKDTVKAHSDNVKRIKAEIKDILDGEDAEVTAAQKDVE